MENILEIIFTIVVAFFWLFGGSLFKKRDENESYQQTSSQRNKRTRDDQTDDDSEVRHREIREAIHRKIAELRQQSEPEPMIAFEPEPKEQVSKPFVFAESPEEPVEVSFSRNIKGNAYEQKMQERLQEIEATKRKAEALQNRLKQITFDDEDADSGRSSGHGQEPALSLGSVSSALKNPKNVRAAFVYKEILGKPVGLRIPSEIGA